MAEIESKNNEAVEKNTNEDETSGLELKIINQIEYYFGDSNLNRDKFLLEQIGKDEGWVPISVLLTFKRLAKLSEDPEVIAQSLLKSDEGLIEISDDHTKIRRHPERPIPERNEESRKEILSRTAYVKGFPLNLAVSDIIDYFQEIEKKISVYIRKYLDKPTKTYKFKGSVFVTFNTKEQCEEFLKKDKVEYAGRELIRKWQANYLEEKRNERENKKKKHEKNKPENNESKIELPKGAVIYFEGVTSDSTTREHVKSAFEKLGADVAYIDFSKGEKNGYVRFNAENSAEDIIKKCSDNKIKIEEGDLELCVKTIEGDEEKEYLTKIVESMKTKRQNARRFKGRQHHGGGNRKRKGSENDNEPSFKHNKSNKPQVNDN